MFKLIDNLLNKITMYRLVVYMLLFLLLVAFVLCYFNILPYSPFALLFSTLFITLACWVTNEIFAKIFRAITNVESIYITALILALIITPASSPTDWAFFSLAAWASIWSMAGKYILAIWNKHLFNPAALAVVITAFAMNLSASWWVGTLWMMPFVLVTGLLIVKKIRRFDLVLAFFLTSLLSILTSGFLRHVNPWTMFTKTIIETPIFFFAFVMLTEPLTTPPTKGLRMLYGAIVGFLFAPWVHVASIYTTPELALVAGNVFSYLVSPKKKLVMNLKEKIAIADHTSDFLFTPTLAFAYNPGQYMEFTLGHDKPDSRGNRRYFTLASSPTEKDLRLGVKFYPHGSSFKGALSEMTQEDVITAAQLAGDFTLPKDPNQKLVFIAGGIGVTPFRSMIKYLIDQKEKRDIIIFYSNKTAADIAYADIFEAARRELGIKTIYVLTDKDSAPPNWRGRVGLLDASVIAQEVPDFASRSFYLSGPHGLVTAFEKTLSKMGVPKHRVKKDFFPGFA